MEEQSGGGEGSDGGKVVELTPWLAAEVNSRTKTDDGGVTGEGELLPAVGATPHAVGSPLDPAPEAMAAEGKRIAVRFDAAPDVLDDESRVVPICVNAADGGMHGLCDLEESRTLQIGDGQVSNYEISRTISTVVGPPLIERYFGTWENMN